MSKRRSKVFAHYCHARGALKGLTNAFAMNPSLRPSQMRAEEDKERRRKEGERRKLVRRFSVGQIVRGKITNITPFGALLALGDIYGLLHISEMSSSALESPMKRFTIGQKLRVRVVHVDRVNGKLGLSLKRLLPSNGKTTKPSNGKTTRRGYKPACEC